MTDEELLSMKKISVEDAARYLQNGTTAQEIRLQAQHDMCDYCTAHRGKGRYAYRVNVGKLIKFKHGDI